MTDLTPEHTFRPHGSDSYSEVIAAYKYVDSVLLTADAQSFADKYAWYGWALREAFLAGCSHAAALAQPEPVAPPMPVPGDAEGLAEVFWNRYDQPEPVAPTHNEIDEQTATLIPWLLEGAIQAADSDQPYAAGKLTLAAQLLGELCPTIQPEPVAVSERLPVPVSERLPGPEDCDERRRCWWYLQRNVVDDPGLPNWTLDTYRANPRHWLQTHWLPYWVLPVPNRAGDQ
jgi:hypothetical protein